MHRRLIGHCTVIAEEAVPNKTKNALTDFNQLIAESREDFTQFHRRQRWMTDYASESPNKMLGREGENGKGGEVVALRRIEWSPNKRSLLLTTSGS